MCCLQGFQLWQCHRCLWEAVSAAFERGFGTFTLDSHLCCFRFPEAAACRQPPCCDAPACPMAEVPGRPAGAWRSPVGSWVSETFSSVCKTLPALITPVFSHSGSCEKPSDMGCCHQPLLACLIMLSWRCVRWKKVCWVVMDAWVFSFLSDVLGRRFPQERWLCVGWMGRIEKQS